MPARHSLAPRTKAAPRRWLVTLLLSAMLTPPVGHAECEADTTDSPATAFLVGAVPAAPCRFPYMVSLSRPIFGTHLCGATLVHASWLLTAASCVDIRSGQVPNPNASINGLLQGVPESFQEVHATNARAIKTHPKYAIGQEDYNVALLKLDVPSKQPLVKLMSPEDELEPGEQVAYVGWGRVGGPRGGFSPHLMVAVDSGIVDPQICEVFGAVEGGGVWCAGEGVKGICQGDEGGPVLRLGGNASEDVQVGIAGTGGNTCGTLGIPTLFTGLSHIVQWINDTITAEG